jgi:hypothetical protein
VFGGDRLAAGSRASGAAGSTEGQPEQSPLPGDDPTHAAVTRAVDRRAETPWEHRRPTYRGIRSRRDMWGQGHVRGQMRRAPPAVTPTTLSGAPTVYSCRLCLPARAISTRIATFPAISPFSVVATCPRTGQRAPGDGRLARRRVLPRRA